MEVEAVVDFTPPRENKRTLTMLPQQPLPQNIEAEQAVLGAILIEGNIISQVLEILTSEDFHRESHRKIFEAMIELDKNSNPIDILILFDYLKSHGQLLEEVGGRAYLTYLSEVTP